MMLRRRMLHENEKSNDIKYPLIDGIYPQSTNTYYEVKDGVIHVSSGTSRFCLTTPTVPYDIGCVNNESFIILSGSTVLIEMDEWYGLRWQFRTTSNGNINIVQNKEMVLTSDVKNIFAIGTATSEGDINMKFFVNGERWI